METNTTTPTKKKRRRHCSGCGSLAHDLRNCDKKKTTNGAAVRASPNGQALAKLLTGNQRAELAAVVAVCDSLKALPTQRRENVFRAALALLELVAR